ncbi:MAG: hypothetical protein DRO18_00525 [Thermoprotei archaeon]|nr:MAG: hypothetical protein DRO18_00525 [Thermoprotei archaeon]
MFLGIDSVRAVIEYLVLRRLISDVTTILILKEYFVDGESPSDISRKYGISAHTVRGYVERLIEKAGSHHIIPTLIKISLPYIMNLDPMVIVVSGKYYCLECDLTLKSKQSAINHVRRHHKERLERLVNDMLSKVRYQSRR